VTIKWLAWKTGSQTFPVSNDRLKQYGISRDVKHKMLERLEKAGRIKIERHGRHAPLVILLGKPNKGIGR
jgi:ribosomal protein S19E (S16A)